MLRPAFGLRAVIDFDRLPGWSAPNPPDLGAAVR
jgi:hypothetical protein